MSVTKSSNQTIRINLSGKPRESTQTLVLKWATTVGKVIIVITEMIALGALGYRFFVDKNIVDLHDKIKKEQIFLRNQQAREIEYRGLQERLSMIKSVTEDSTSKLNVVNLVLDNQKAGVFSSTNLIVGQKSVVVNGTAPSILTLSPFLNSLKQNPNVLSAAIDEIATGGEGILFKITIILNTTLKP